MFVAKVFHKIPFHDVDIMHIAWHGHYFKYFELARTQLMQDLGLDWPILMEQGISMPVVDADVQYRRPLAYDQIIEIEAHLEEFQYPELKIAYKIRDEEGVVNATGHTRQVYVNTGDRSTYFVVPDFIKERMEGFRRC